jgi:3-deoxy-D-arabino-heptulosonate 7-phosphate (DAHP) synthase
MKKNKFNIEGLNMTSSKEDKTKNYSKSNTTIKQKGKVLKGSTECWLYIQSTEKYRNYVALETCRRTTESLKSELFDGVSIVLNERNSGKSDKIQKRIMRRIIEKRQAQAAHHKLGRTADLFVPNIERVNVSRCMYEFA